MCIWTHWSFSFVISSWYYVDRFFLMCKAATCPGPHPKATKAGLHRWLWVSAARGGSSYSIRSTDLSNRTYFHTRELFPVVPKHFVQVEKKKSCFFFSFRLIFFKEKHDKKSTTRLFLHWRFGCLSESIF